MPQNNTLADELRNMASSIEGLEDDYDRLVNELEEERVEIDLLKGRIDELHKYIDWAESFYPDMAGQYKAICDVRG